MTQPMYDIVSPVKRPPRRRRRTNLTLRLAALLANAMTNRDTIAEAARRLELRPRTTQSWFRMGMVDQMLEVSHQKSGCCALCGHESRRPICGPCSTTLESRYLGGTQEVLKRSVGASYTQGTSETTAEVNE